ncbi:TonB-dependent receptor plug domain-containing protein [Sandaracinobacteroides hominis]|uniref:TonB-dependent receptor plug domain-containing protein n=1 Tax=Sandaracinobacteroides hominis TaxID=2780086 RepID=UPI001F32BEAC|nr:TonB-dependent receptor [Sandaracinobacteroides hominis]
MRRLLLAAALGTAAAIPAHANDMDDIVVSVSRQSLSADQIAGSLSVLDKPAIDRAGDLVISDLLLRTPGVSLTRNGGYGTTTAVRIRGAESEQTVLLIDGVKLNDMASAGGGYNFANLLTGDASRIEILRRPQSILWGSQAIGGIVSVETPLATRPLEGSLDLEGGSRGTVSARAALGAVRGPLSVRVAGQVFTTSGVSAISPDFGGTEADGYSNQSLTGRAVLQLSPALSADFRGYHASGRTDIDSTRADSAEVAYTSEYAGYAGLVLATLDGRLRHRLGFSQTGTDRANFNPTLARQQTFDANGRTRRVDYQGNFDLRKGISAVFGAEHEESRFRSVSPPASLSRPVPEPARGQSATDSVYAQLSLEPLNGLTLSGGLRFDEHDSYGGKLLGAAGAVWRTPIGATLRASWSEGFKAPTLYQRFSEYGNDRLRPEQARGWEVGAEQPLFGERLFLGATWFQRKSSDLIIYTGCAAVSSNPLCFTPAGQPRAGYYENVSEAFAHGVEAVVRASPLDGLTLEGNYSLAASEDRSPGSATNGLQLPRRPRQSWYLGAGYAPSAGYRLAVSIRHSGEAFDNASHSIRLAPYTLVDLRAELPVSDEIRLVVRADNLFDTRYQTAYRYGTLGRSLYAGLRARF